MDPFVIEVLFALCGRLVLTEHGAEMRGPRQIEEIIGTLIADDSFQDLKKRFERDSFLQGGPFSEPNFLTDSTLGCVEE